jgi:hypothetical protein
MRKAGASIGSVKVRCTSVWLLHFPARTVRPCSSYLCASYRTDIWLTAADAGSWLVRTPRPDAGALRWLTGMVGGAGASAPQDRFPESVDTLLATVPGARRLLLFLDQAEAIFLLPSKDEQALLLALLDRLRRVDKCVVLLAMRADFYADLMTSILWPVTLH